MRVAGACAALVVMLASQLAVAAPTASFGTPKGGWTVGTGQPDDGFNLSTNDESEVQVGLRSQDYQVGVSANNGIGGDYFVSPGERALNSGLALWNLDFSIDTGLKEIRSLDVTLTVDWDPGAGVDLVAYDIDALLAASPQAVLQGSENLGFPFWQHPFNPFATGTYAFTLSVANRTGGAPLASTTIRVNVNGVPEPGTLALAGFALAGLGFRARRSSRGS